MDQRTISIKLQSGNVVSLTVTEMPDSDPLMVVDLWCPRTDDPAEPLAGNEIVRQHIAEHELLAHAEA